MLRQHIRRVGRAVYWRLPGRWRDSVVEFSYRHAGSVFRGLGHYEMWRRQRRDDEFIHAETARPGLTDLTSVPPLGAVSGRVAIHVHLFYAELAREFAARLRNMPFHYDLFVSVTNEDGKLRAERAFRRLPRMGRLKIQSVPNRGRDIAPMLCAFGDELRGYDYIAHVHTKKSLYNRGATDGWREYLLASLFGSADRIRRIFSLLQGGVGMVYPQTFHRVPYAGSTWLANRANGRAWCSRLGIRNVPNGYFDFPVGSMFWARADALRALFDGGITIDDFDVEMGQNDGTFAHVVERLLGVVARDSGLRIAILRDTSTPSWSPWRFEQYLHRDRVATEAFLRSPEVRLVIFDVFDTLLLRPLIDPEQIKAIVARNAGGDLGDLYLRWRAEAEHSVRVRTGRDVGLDAIMRELGRLARLDKEDVDRLHDLELHAEKAAVAPRPGALAMLECARASGKKVALASDMYLSADTIEAMLANHGFTGWHALYLSSEIGLRKDTGALYAHILEAEGLEPGRVMMVGDNERSDLQIPGDAGFRPLHLLRPVELGRAMVRLGPLVEEVERSGSVDAHLGLGLLVRGLLGKLHFDKGFDPVSIMPEPDGDNLGYAVCGPLVFAFTQWLMDRAREDRIERLYFLAREGQFLKMVYDRVARHVSGAPESAYLVVSRRALNVPGITSLDDALFIAGAHYGPAPLEEFLFERFGLELDAAERQDLFDSGLWEKGRLVEVSANGMGELPRLLEALLPRILRQGQVERIGIMSYLREMNVSVGAHAVVDVGFSGTIQRGLNALLGGGVHGYYMATLANTEAMETSFNVRASGCYFNRASLTDVPLFIGKSFVAEKMLSANDTQVIRYSLDADGKPVPEFRNLSRAEQAVFPLRASIRQGALRFVDEAIDVQTRLLSDFRFPPELAVRLFETLVDGVSSREAEILGRVVLDDHYCGRGLVS